jgi:hypothetical protein
MASFWLSITDYWLDDWDSEKMIIRSFKLWCSSILAPQGYSSSDLAIFHSLFTDSRHMRLIVEQFNGVLNDFINGGRGPWTIDLPPQYDHINRQDVVEDGTLLIVE